MTKHFGDHFGETGGPLVELARQIERRLKAVEARQPLSERVFELERKVVFLEGWVEGMRRQMP